MVLQGNHEVPLSKDEQELQLLRKLGNEVQRFAMAHAIKNPKLMASRWFATQDALVAWEVWKEANRVEGVRMEGTE